MSLGWLVATALVVTHRAELDALTTLLCGLAVFSIFHLIVLSQMGEFRGMLSVKDILRVVASDEKARADLLEAFIFPQR